MARKPIPETTDAETELAECRDLRREIEKQRLFWEEKKTDAKLAKETFDALVDELLARLGDEDRPLLAMAEDDES